MQQVSRAMRVEGFSLIELAIVLLIFGAILGSVWAVAARGWDSAKRQTAVEAIAATVANIRGFYAGAAMMPNDGFAKTTNDLLAAQVIPPSLNRGTLCAGNQCADTPWGPYSGGAVDAAGTFRVCRWAIGLSKCPAVPPHIASSPFFGVALSGLSIKNCIALVETISGSTGPSGLVEVNINGTNLLAAGKPIQPVSAADATAKCALAGNGSEVVTFVYRITAPSP